MAERMDGKLVAATLRGTMKEKVDSIKSSGSRVPGLAVVIVGEDPASKVYVKNKKIACGEIGILSEEYALPADTKHEDLEKLINELNEKETIDGILLQSPLPKHLDETYFLRLIAKEKDVDAFNPYNVGKIMIGDFDFQPCTPAGVMELLKFYNIDPAGKNCVMVGRSNIVGKPMAMLMLHANATVTICHSKTKNLGEITKTADILIVAIRQAKYITADMIKEGAVVIDVGMNRNEEGKLCGDVDYAEAQNVASYITPVPGGVGPMTITMLMQNTIKSFELKNRG